MAGSVLETFIFKYISDTEDLEKGQKEAETLSDKVESSLEDTDKATQELGKSFTDMITQAGAAIGALIAVRAVAANSLQAAEQAFEVNLLSDALGENAAELDAWGAAVGAFGGTASEFQSTIENFNQRIQELALVGENDLSPVMRHLGVDFLDAQRRARDVMDILPELADSFQGISQGEALGLGEKLGLDRSTIMLLQEGRKEVERVIKRQKELSNLDQEFIDISKDFKIALMDNDRAFTGVWQTVGKLFIPALTGALEIVTDLILFFRRHETFAESFFQVLAIGAFMLAVKFAPAVFAATAAVWSFIAPFVVIPALFGLAAVAIGLLIDDFVTFFEGGESIVGGFIEYIMRIPEAFNFVRNQISGFINDINPFGSSVEVSGGLDAAQGALAAANSGIGASTSNSISTTNSRANKTNNVNVGTVEVNTQATDADGISNAIGNSLQTQLANVTDDFSDSIEA